MGERESALRDAGILTSAEVPEEECLAMKASLAIPCHNLNTSESTISMFYNMTLLHE